MDEDVLIFLDRNRRVLTPSQTFCEVRRRIRPPTYVDPTERRSYPCTMQDEQDLEHAKKMVGQE